MTFPSSPKLTSEGLETGGPLTVGVRGPACTCVWSPLCVTQLLVAAIVAATASGP